MFSYFPIIRTKDSELMAYKMLDDKVKDGSLPIFELTKSRLSSKNPNMSLSRRLSELVEIMKDRPFIMDLSAEQKYSNPELESMLLNRNKDGFKQWREFIKNCREVQGLNAIPILHYNIIELDELKKEIENMSSLPLLALRVYIGDGDIIHNVIDVVKKNIEISKVILIVDYEFQSNNDTCRVYPQYNLTSTILNDVDRIIFSVRPNTFKEIIYAFSSFPASVQLPGYGEGYEHGTFKISEIITSKSLKSEKICHGDYASIHPLSYDSFGKWIPRIDFVSNDDFVYHRCARNKGGYIEIGKRLCHDEKYKPINEIQTWGNDEISECMKGQPQRVNPAHWISVRMNLYMTLRYLELSQNGYHSTTF